MISRASEPSCAPSSRMVKEEGDPLPCQKRWRRRARIWPKTGPTETLVMKSPFLETVGALVRA